MTGTFVTLAHPLLVQQAFDGRFYGPWFAMIAWYCPLLNRHSTRPTIATTLIASLLSILICTIHYFGLFSWVLITAFQPLCFWDRSLRSLLRWSGLLLGPVSLVACVAIFYPGQRAAISVPTWVENPSFAQIHEFRLDLFPAFVLALPGFVALIDGLVRSYFEKQPRTIVDLNKPLMRLVGAASLAFLPVIIIAFSCVMQPALIHRYATPTILCVGSVVAWSLRFVHQSLLFMVMGVFLSLATLSFGLTANSSVNQDSAETLRILETIPSQDDNPVTVMVLSDRRRMAYQIWRYALQLRNFVAMVGLTEVNDGRIMNIHRLERDVASRLHQLYQTPRIMKLADLAGLNIVYLLGARAEVNRIADRLADYAKLTVSDKKPVCLKLTRNSPESGMNQ